jgi:NRPS condensation-like uncharacterized protein
MSHQIGKLSAKKQELLDLLLKKKGLVALKGQSITRLAPGDKTILSFAQRRLWFLHQLEPDNPAYNVAAAYRVAGRLDLVAFQRSLDEVRRRHEVLRAAFDTENGEPIQRVSRYAAQVSPRIDLTPLPDPVKASELERIVRQEAHCPFRLADGNLLRVTIVDIAEMDRMLLFTMHHIISDGWSISIIIREMIALYEAFVHGKPSPLAELPIQYSDFAHWHRQLLGGEALDSQLEYWKSQLAGATGEMRWPFAPPRACPSKPGGRKQTLKLSSELTGKLKETARSEGITLFMCLLALFKATLYSYTRQEDLLVGTPIAYRNWPETEGLVGMFVNTLVLRTRVSGDMTFRQLLRRVRDVAHKANDNQDVPFEKIVEALQPERDLSRNPFFQVWLVLQNAHSTVFDLPGVKMSLLDTEKQSVRHDLSLSLEETPQGIDGSFEYKANLFEDFHISEMIERIKALAEFALTHLDMTLAELADKLAQSEKRFEAARQKEFKEMSRTRLSVVKRRAVGQTRNLQE